MPSDLKHIDKLLSEINNIVKDMTIVIMADTDLEKLSNFSKQLTTECSNLVRYVIMNEGLVARINAVKTLYAIKFGVWNNALMEADLHNGAINWNQGRQPYHIKQLQNIITLLSEFDKNVKTWT